MAKAHSVVTVDLDHMDDDPADLARDAATLGLRSTYKGNNGKHHMSLVTGPRHKVAAALTAWGYDDVLDIYLA